MIVRNVTCLALASFLAMLQAACASPAYYLQAISGQLKLMNARQHVAVLLSDPLTSPDLSAQLEKAGQIIQYAESTLGLPANDSYTSYVEIGGSALVWNVVATGKFSLTAREWCFPVAGCVPYRGYFKQKKAEDFAAKLKKKGMDVFVSPAPAYSSLGWFRDPLFSTMFAGSDLRLAAYLFHELAHQRLYVKGDGLFNESYASFVEQASMQSWLESNQQYDELHQWQQYQSAKQNFTALIGEVRGKLEFLYRSGNSEVVMRQQKTEILNDLRQAFERTKTVQWQDKNYFPDWFDKPVNNARLALYNTYEGSQCAFERLLDQSGGNIQKFHRLADQHSRLPKTSREEWLKQSCTPIASTDNL